MGERWPKLARAQSKTASHSLRLFILFTSHFGTVFVLIHAERKFRKTVQGNAKGETIFFLDKVI